MPDGRWAFGARCHLVRVRKRRSELRKVGGRVRLEYFDATRRRKKNIRTNCNNLIEASLWSESQVSAQSINLESQVLREAHRSEVLQSVLYSDRRIWSIRFSSCESNRGSDWRRRALKCPLTSANGERKQVDRENHKFAGRTWNLAFSRHLFIQKVFRKWHYSIPHTTLPQWWRLCELNSFLCSALVGLFTSGNASFLKSSIYLKTASATDSSAISGGRSASGARDKPKITLHNHEPLWNGCA